MKRANDSFYSGILAALAVIKDHDQETLYREVLNMLSEAEVKELIDFAWRNSDLEWSGLVQYGYAVRKK